MTENSEPRALAIDDDPLVGATFASHAHASGFAVKITQDPDEFMTLEREWKPDVVVVDLVMGEVDGIEILRRLADVRSTATVVIASGMGAKVLESAQHFAAASGLTYGGVLSKPFRRADVASVLMSKAHAPEAKHHVEDVLGGWGRKTFEKALRAAAEGELWVAYQPKTACSDQRVVGYEALVRWQHPELGLIPPIAFIPRAESVGLSGLVTEAVAREALGWFGKARAGTGETLSLNISASELGDAGLCTRLLKACGTAAVNPQQVIVEITETSALAENPEPLATLTRLRLDGFQLSIDDFGTGYSSMSQLSSVPFTEVKIDKSFVRDLGSSLPADVMVRSMLQLSRGLGLHCTAEGVENALALQVLRDMGCDYAQGYHIAKPMPHAELELWLAAQ